MKINNLINKELSSELKYVDIKTESVYKEEKINIKDKIKNTIKFNFKSIDTCLYKNEIILTIVALLLCVTSILLGDFISILNPIFMICFITLLSSNPVYITNNRHLDVGAWNLISSFGIIIKSFNFTRISASYIELTDFFTKIFLYTLIFSGIPAFNMIFVLVTLGLTISYLLCFINKNIKYIKTSINTIESKYLLYIIPSMIIFLIFFKGNVVNLTVFTTIVCFKYFNNCIQDYDINIIKDAN